MTAAGSAGCTHGMSSWRPVRWRRRTSCWLRGWKSGARRVMRWAATSRATTTGSRSASSSTPPDRGHRFVKQVAVTDFYLGHRWTGPGKLGVLQQMAMPPLSVVAQQIPRWLVPAAGQVLGRSAALLGIAEDEPQLRNGVTIDRSERDRFGLPRLTVQHEYTARDRQAGAALGVLRPAHPARGRRAHLLFPHDQHVLPRARHGAHG